jgi:putative ABC transport system permease protein
MGKDLSFAIRSLRRVPGFVVAVVLTLGLGIGATTAIFSVVRAVLLKPLPHQQGDRLLYLRQSIGGPGGENIRFSVPEILDFRDHAKSLGGIAEYSGVTLTMEEAGAAARITVGLVTGNYFTVMGLSPVLGRLTSPADDGTGVPPVMVLSHDFWLRRFGGDPGVIGKTVRVSNQAVTIIGVVQAAPSFPERMDALMNMVISEHHTSALMVQGRTHRMTDMIARLAPDASVVQAQGEIADIRTRVQSEYPDAYDPASNYQVSVIPFRQVLGEQARLTLWLLMGAAGFVLVIACANVANLTLMRGVRREQELVIRAALGAGSGVLRRLLLAENLVLALLGGALGLVVAFGGVGLLTSFAARYSPRADEIAVDGVVLAFALLVALLVAVLLSFGPKFVREDALGGWLTGAGKSSAGRRRLGLQRALVVAQVAVSVVLLSGAGLLTRTMLRLSEVETGYNAEDVLTMEVPMDFGGRPVSDLVTMYRRMQGELAAIAGVTQVGLGSTIPLRANQRIQLELKAEGRPVAAGEPTPRADYRTASPEYFEAAGVPLVSGRPFASTDEAGSALVVILSQSLAERLFPGKDPVGQRIAWTGDVLRFIGVSGEWRTVVGIVGDTKDDGLDAPPSPAVFMPFSQGDFPSGAFVIRARRDAAAIAGSATRVVRSVEPLAPIENVMTVSQVKSDRVAPRRLNATLVGLFGALAVLIAAVGIGGVLAFSVSARTNEIGIRMSLGAGSAQVQRMILGEGGVLLVVGLGFGMVGAMVVSRMMRGLLFGVTPSDPTTLVAVALLMVTIGVLACWIPAIRAARINPAITMRAS